MKRVLIVAILIASSTLICAYCPSSASPFLANGSIPCASGLSSDPSQVHAYLWLQGKADWATNGTAQVTAGNCAAGGNIGGCDSDGIEAVDTDCTYMADHVLITNDCAGVGSAGDYFLWTDWYTSQYDGCPSTSSSERAILLIYDDDGKYVLQSRSQGKVWENWDEIGTSAADTPGASFHLNEVYPWSMDQDGYYYADTYLEISSSVTYGDYSAGDTPSSPLVTGYRVYYYNRCEWPPTDFSKSAWVAGATYPIGTINFQIRAADFPSVNSLYLAISPALIIEGKELPLVSSSYIKLVDWKPDSFDGEPCGCGSYYSPFDPWCNVSGISPVYFECMLDGVIDPPYYSVCGVEHAENYRASWGNWTGCWTDPYYFNEPSDTVINSISDNDPNSLTGVTLNFTPTVPASRHDLYVDGNLVKTGILPGETYGGGLLSCNTPHTFQIAAQVDWRPPLYDTTECSTYWSNIVTATDSCVSAPGELAPGGSSGDAMIWTFDKVTQFWPSYAGATGYRLYRGTQADLQNLPGGAVDNCCARYDGTSTSVDLSGDAPASESFFWYLVTAYNSSGEGPVGTGRIINSSGACP